MLFDYALSRGFGYDSYETEGRDCITPELSLFENPKKSFKSLSKFFEYTPLIQTIDNNPDGVWVSLQEFGYLSSKKSNISFLITSSFYKGDGQSWNDPEPIKIFKNINNEKIKKLPNILLNILKNKFKKNEKHSLINLVNLNNKYTWDKKLLEIVFNKDLKIRKKSKRDDRKDGLLNYPDWYYNIFFFLTTQNKMISKVPANINFSKSIMTLS